MIKKKKKPNKRKNYLLPGETEDKYEGADFKYLNILREINILNIQRN